MPKLKHYSKTDFVKKTKTEKKTTKEVLIYFYAFIYFFYVCMQHLLGSLVVLLHPTLVQASLEVYTWISHVFQRWEPTSTTELRAVPACISLGEVAPLVEPNPTSLRPCLELPRWGETFSAPRNTHSHTFVKERLLLGVLLVSFNYGHPRRTTSNHRTKHYKCKYGSRLASGWKV